MFIHQRADQGERLRPRLRVYDLFDAIQRGTDLAGIGVFGPFFAPMSPRRTSSKSRRFPSVTTRTGPAGVWTVSTESWGSLA
jgi:hypothetical protein